MEYSQPLATDSFSYNWLTDKRPPIPDNLIPTSYLEDEDNSFFKFDIPVSASQASLVSADEIFSCGQLIPSRATQGSKDSVTNPTSPVSSHSLSSTSFVLNNKTNGIKWRKSSKRIFNKCWDYACKSIGLSRRTNQVNDLERKVNEARTWNGDSLSASLRRSLSHSVTEWGDVMRTGRRIDRAHGLKKVNSWRKSPIISPCCLGNSSCDVEDSIQEAILYCKRTIEKSEDMNFK